MVHFLVAYRMHIYSSLLILKRISYFINVGETMNEAK